MRVPPLSCELRLLAACATWPRGAIRDAGVRAAAHAIRDWERFWDATQRHRMTCIALDGLGSAGVAVPPALKARLQTAARHDARQVLALVAEIGALDGLLAGAGIAMTVVKGPPLGLLAFGDLTMRQCRDVDVLVRPDEIMTAHDILVAAGYAQIEPDHMPRRDQLRRWLRSHKDITYRNPRSGLLIELHCRLTSNPHLLPLAAFQHAPRPLQIARGIAPLTLQDDDLLLYLCVHGAVHLWVRLKWLADVAAMFARYDSARLERFHARAAVLGLDRPVGLALWMAADVFGLALPAQLHATLSRDLRLRLLRRNAMRLLTEPREQMTLRFATTLNGMSQYLLRSEWRFRARELRQPLVDWKLASALGGSGTAVTLSIVLRPFAWLWRKTFAL